MNEEWRAIEEAPGYEVSNLGRVKSLAKLKWHTSVRGDRIQLTTKEKILKPCKDAEGYVHYRLRVDNRLYILRKGHHLVAAAFLRI